LYVLVFLEIGSRRVVFCNATEHPDSAWVAEQACNLAWELEELKIPIKVLIRDRDSKYNSDFDAPKSTHTQALVPSSTQWA
jgi:putative transposase